MKLGTMAKRGQSKPVIVAVFIAIIGAGLLAWWKFSRRSELPVYNVIEASELGCSDAGHEGDSCHPYRVAGTIVAAPVPGSSGSNSEFEFTITDGCLEYQVSYHGDPARPPRFNAGQFVVVEGVASVDGNFHSATVFLDSEAVRLGGDLRHFQSNVPHIACLESRAATEGQMRQEFGNDVSPPNTNALQAPTDNSA